MRTKVYQPLGAEQSENQELLFKQPVILIFWMMAIDGGNMDRKLSREIPTQGTYNLAFLF